MGSASLNTPVRSWAVLLLFVSLSFSMDGYIKSISSPYGVPDYTVQPYLYGAFNNYAVFPYQNQAGWRVTYQITNYLSAPTVFHLSLTTAAGWMIFHSTRGDGRTWTGTVSAYGTQNIDFYFDPPNYPDQQSLTLTLSTTSVQQTMSFNIYSDTSGPSKPVITAAGISDTQIKVTWTRPSDLAGVQGYEVYMDNVAQSGKVTDPDSTKTVTTTSGPHTFSVKAFDNVGHYTWSDTITATTVYTISGSVKTGTGASVGPVAMYAVPGGDTTNTDPGLGTYTLLVPPSWTGVVKPSDPLLSFTPDSISFTSISANASAQNFVAAFLTKPTPVSPASGAINVAMDAPIIWTKTATATYALQIAASSDFSSPLVNTKNLTDTSSGDIIGLSRGKYYWRVRSDYLGFEGPWSMDSFTTVPEVPGFPNLLSPSNGAADQPVNLTLLWNSVTNAPVDSYLVEVSASSGFSPLFFSRSHATDTSADISGLTKGITYYWRVTASNVSGSNTATWQFNVIDPVLPNAPGLVSPASSQTSVPVLPLMVWNTTAITLSYNLNISDIYGTVFDTAGLTDTTFQLPDSLKFITNYYWRVRAKSADGFGSWSSSYGFTTVTGPPPAPTLSSPADKGTGLSVSSVALLWNTVSTATSYQLQAATQSDFSAGSLIKDSSGITVLTATLETLTSNTQYYWRVRAANVSGSGAWSSSRSFYTSPDSSFIPRLIAPDSGALDVPPPCILTWQNKGALQYTLQISVNSNMSVIVFTKTDIADSFYTSLLPNVLSYKSTYYWRVSALFAGGQTGYSPVWEFTTAPEPPAAASLSSPSSGATDIAIDTVLAWSAVFTATSYRVQLSTTSDFSTPQIDSGSLTGTLYVLPKLSTATTWYWRVCASNAGGSGPWSDTWNFTTVPAPPAPPTLTSPSDNALDQPLQCTLTWNPSPGSVTYHAQLSITADFGTTLLNDSSLSTTSISTGILATSTTYFWRVRTKNAGGTGNWSEIFRFTTIPPVPATPILALPAAEAENQALILALSWDSVPGAGTYRLQLSVSGAFSTVVIDDSLLKTGTAQAGPLAASTSYYWRVNAKNAGGTSAWSEIRHFTTVPPAADAPSLVSPAQFAMNQSLSPSLVWNTVAGATQYRLQFSSTVDFATPILDESSLADTIKALSGLLTGTTYYWRVAAKNTGGFGSWSEIRGFTTIPPAPAAPPLLSPADSAIDQSTMPMLSWNTVSGAETYHLQVSVNAGFTTLVKNDSGLSGTFSLVTSLTSSTTYYWRARAKNSGGISAWSSIRRFTTLPNEPVVPTLLSPPDNAADQPVTFTLFWSSQSEAKSYRLQVYTADIFNSITAYDTTVTDTLFTVGPLSAGTAYLWRVNATNSSGTSSWPSARRFVTLPAAPAAPTPLSPADSATDRPFNLSLLWATSANTQSYRVQVSTSSGFNTIVVDDSLITDTSRTIGPLTAGTDYYWRVNAKNSGGTSAWSTARVFTTLPSPPTAPLALTPANGSVNLPIQLTFCWGQSATTESYQFQLSSTLDFSALSTDTSGLTDTSLALANLLNDNNYFWRVRAHNSGGDGPWSAVCSLTTIVALPGTAVLFTPANGDTLWEDSVLFAWHPAGMKTDRYRITWATDSLFSAYKTDSSLSDTTKLVRELQPDQRYWWRVQAHNAAGWGPLSSTASFLITLPSASVLSENTNFHFNIGIGGIIRYTVPKEGNVSVALYSVSGKCVYAGKRDKQQSGWYTWQLPENTLRPGLYALRFGYNGTVFRRIIFLK